MASSEKGQTAASYESTFESGVAPLKSGGKMLIENGKYQCAEGKTWTAVGRRGSKSIGNRG